MYQPSLGQRRITYMLGCMLWNVILCGTKFRKCTLYGTKFRKFTLYSTKYPLMDNICTKYICFVKIKYTFFGAIFV